VDFAIVHHLRDHALVDAALLAAHFLQHFRDREGEAERGIVLCLAAHLHEHVRRRAAFEGSCEAFVQNVGGHDDILGVDAALGAECLHGLADILVRSLVEGLQSPDGQVLCVGGAGHQQG
jgi:hypothetical protein